MGWQDRQYDRDVFEDSAFSAGGIRRPPTGALALMILHGAALVLMLMLARGDGEFIVRAITLEGPSPHPLGIVLHPLATTRVLSALFAVLALWSLGGRIEARLGTGRLVQLYVIGNVLAGAVYFGVARIAGGLAAAPLDYPVGGLAALCVAAWQHLQQDQVQVLGRVRSIAKVYAICGAVVVALAVVGAGLGAAAWVAGALGGAPVGMVCRRGLQLPTIKRVRPRRVVRPSSPQRPASPASGDPEIDDILAKISRTGMGSLTAEERERLEQARRAKLAQRK